MDDFSSIILNLSVLGWVPSEIDSDTSIQVQQSIWKGTLGKKWKEGSRSWLWVIGLSPTLELVGPCGRCLRALPPKEWWGHHIHHQPPLVFCHLWLLSGHWSPSISRLSLPDRAGSHDPHSPGQVELQACLWSSRNGVSAGEEGQSTSQKCCCSFIFTFHFRSIMNYKNTVLHSNFHWTKNYHRPYVFTQRRPYFSLETIFVNLLKCVLLVCFYIQTNWI